MDTASLQFVLFGLIAAALSNLSRSRVWRSIVIMLASLIFLAMLAKSAVVLIPLAAFLLFGYGALAIRERGWLEGAAWSIPAVIVAYVWLKKYTFLPDRFFLHFPYFTLGLSYIFFRILHLLIEAGEGAGVEEKRHVGLGAYLLYTLNFTTLISGPIQRYDEFARDQFALQPLPLEPSEIGLQLERIIRGLFKVNVLALLLHMMQENGLEQLTQPVSIDHKLFAAIQFTIAYPLFLYANFSGYIDIVIALARLMRIRLPENFDRPFSASSFLDFWNRWHITLSTWLKTYVYNPLLLALMRRISSLSLQPFLGVLCFFVTFFLIGVWHGRTSEYIVFGILQGGGCRSQQALATLAYRDPRPQDLQGACQKCDLCCFWPRPDVQLVRLHHVLVLGKLEADRHDLFGDKCCSMGRRVAGDLVRRHRGVGNVGVGACAIAAAPNVGRARAHQSLCAGGLRDRYGRDCSRHRGCAQSARSGNRVQGILARGANSDGISYAQRHPISVSRGTTHLAAQGRCQISARKGLYLTIIRNFDGRWCGERWISSQFEHRFLLYRVADPSPDSVRLRVVTDHGLLPACKE
jgi:alginate O-acetyltransferase complex protein AlgI